MRDFKHDLNKYADLINSACTLFMWATKVLVIFITLLGIAIVSRGIIYIITGH